LISTAEIAEYAEGNLHQFLPARFLSALSACSAVKCFGSDFRHPARRRQPDWPHAASAKEYYAGTDLRVPQIWLRIRLNT